MRTSWVNHGIASVHEDHIEVNRNLKRYPSLLNEIMGHENQHTKKPMDFMVDFKDMFNIKKQAKIFAFTLRHPSALTEMLPVFVDNKQRLSVNYFLCIFYVFISAMILGGI